MAVSFLGLLLSTLTLWHFSCTWLYTRFAPALLSDAASHGIDKKIQLLLMASGILMIPLALSLARRLDPLLRRPACAWVTLAGGITAAALWFGVWPLVYAFVWLGVLSRISAPRIKKWAACILLTAFSILLFILIRPRCDYRILDLYDDGPKLSAVNQAMHGGTPYRDILLHYGPLREIVQPLVAFRLWGVTYDSEQRIRSWLQAFGVVLLFGIVAQVIPRLWLTLVIGILFLIRTDLFIPERVMPVLASVFCMCRALRLREAGEKASAWTLGAGFLAVITLLYSQEMGVTLLAGYAVYFGTLAMLRERRLALLECWEWGLGVIAAVSLGLIYLIHSGGAGFFFSDLWALLAYRMDSWADGLRSHLFTLQFLKSRQALHTFVAMHGVPVLSLTAAGYFIWKSREAYTSSRRWQQGLLLSSIVFVQFSIYIGRSDFNHWKNATGLLWPLGALLLDEAVFWAQSAAILPPGEKFCALAAATLLWMPSFSLLEGRTPWLISILNAPDVLRAPGYVAPKSWAPIGNPDRMGPIPGNPQDLEQIRNVTAWIQDNVPPDGFLFLFTNLGGYYFLTNRQNPTRFGLIDTVLGPRMMDECLGALTKNPPDVVLVTTQSNYSDEWVYRPDLRPIADVLRKAYVPAQRYGDLLLLVTPRARTRQRTIQNSGYAPSMSAFPRQSARKATG